jgi:glycosyltransferase involved in cell wall biosynthesis
MTGDVTQILSTAKALEKHGIKVQLSDSLEPDIRDIDVVHLFDTLEPVFTYLRLKFLKKQNIPVVVSTIYWEWEPEELKNESIIRLGGFGYCLSQVLNSIRKISPNKIRYILDKTSLPYPLQKKYYEYEKRIGLQSMRKFIYENADVLLPNSHTEYRYLESKFGIKNDYIAVPNSVDAVFNSGNPDDFFRKFNVKEFVLCTACVQVRKNQIRLIRAMHNIDCPLVLIGTQEKKYTERCRKEADENVFFLGELKGRELLNAYAAAKVHALVSFYETPGLASLEAAIADTPIVVSDRGCTREYFGNDAFYCDPNSVDSISTAISEALRANPSPSLKDRILMEYNWDMTAKKTIEGYNMAIEKNLLYIRSS